MYFLAKIITFVAVNNNRMTPELIFRIFIGGLLGGLIGMEREYRAKEAGFRTHFLVALGSTLFMIVSQYGFAWILTHSPNVSLDPSRIASQVVTGIGFIGAGTIIFQKHVIRGLTTAAGLWVTSAIGLAVGSGMYLVALSATALVLICLEILYFFINRFGTANVSVTFSAQTRELIETTLSRIAHNHIEIENYHLEERIAATGIKYVVTMDVKIKRSCYNGRILDLIKEFEGVTVEEID
ncbi:Mg2+ transporter-C family protein [Hoylesella marshii DSM 16973 = JCM 13450]|uniref:Mg2+ transporter-C family protein n=2 Tax=Hoylesella marshii TaxID=189722 RepID=E0NTR4_9BACT|nr:Mg2+ transporter-C family protein [Hoylesella marshii DSM 16973 = JCM 13450]